MTNSTNPQLEDGFIQIATGKRENDILMALIKQRLNATQYQIIFLVIRKTWGFKKKEDWISLTQFENYLSKSRASVCKEIKHLVNNNLLVKKSIQGVRASYGINKDFLQWKQLVKKNRLVNKTLLTSKQNKTQLVNKTLPTKETITKETITKETIQKKYSSIKDLDQTVLEEISSKYKVSLSFVKSKLDDMTNWLGAKGKKYKNYKAALSNWVKTDALKIIQKEHRSINKFKITKV